MLFVFDFILFEPSRVCCCVLRVVNVGTLTGYFSKLEYAQEATESVTHTHIYKSLHFYCKKEKIPI